MFTGKKKGNEISKNFAIFLKLVPSNLIFNLVIYNESLVSIILILFYAPRPSRSPSPEDRLGEYLKAERQGRRTGDCSSYREGCQQSFFVDGPRKERE